MGTRVIIFDNLGVVVDAVFTYNADTGEAVWLVHTTICGKVTWTVRLCADGTCQELDRVTHTEKEKSDV